MKLQSIRTMAGKALSMIRRFPLIFIAAIIACSAFSVYIHNSFSLITSEWPLKLAAVSMVGFSLLAALYLTCERLGFKALKSNLLTALISIPLLALYYLNFHFEIVDALRLWIILVGTHLAVILSNPLGDKDQLRFWYFGKLLFLRALSSAFFTLVLVGGFSLSLYALETLFKIGFSSKSYAYLNIWLIGIFNTIFFFIGIPRKEEEFAEKSNYPRSIKFFTQYILLPIISVNFLILITYAFTILFRWELPKGMVSTVVLWYSFFGIAAILLIYPFKDSENKLVSYFSKLFFPLHIPLNVLMAIAVIKRVGDYGITLDRYLLIIALIWLAFIAFYFIISGKKSIKSIPYSLLLLAIIIPWGSWGIFSVPENSQMARLENIINKYKLPKTDSSQTVVNARDYRSLTTIADYLESNHNSGLLKSYFKNKLHIKPDSSSNASYKITHNLNLVSESDVAFSKDNNWILLNDKCFREYSLDISGYNKMYELELWSDNKRETKNIDSQFYCKLDSKAFKLAIHSSENWNDSLLLDFSHIAGLSAVKEKLDLSEAVITGENSKLRVKLVVRNCYVDSKDGKNLKSAYASKIEGLLFYKIK